MIRTFYDGGTAPEALLRECWTFRLSLVDLRPEVPPERDWEAFRTYFRPGVTLGTLRSDDGRLAAMFAWSIRTARHGSEAHTVIDADYGFTRPDVRQRGLVASVLLRMWLAALRHGGRTEVTLVGSGYPSGVMGFGRMGSRIRSLSDADIEPWERDLILEHCAEHDCIDPERGVLRMRTRPRETRRTPRTEQSRALLGWYEAQVPRWEEGNGLAYVVRFAPLTQARQLIRETVRRRLGR